MPSNLSGFPGCNEQLPVDAPQEVYVFHQIMHFDISESGTKRSLVIPPEVANPALVRKLRTQLGSHADPVLAELKSRAVPLDPTWDSLQVAPAPPVPDVLIEDVDAVLAAGKVSHGGQDYDISMLGDVLAAIDARRAIEVTLGSAAGAQRLRLVPKASSSCAIPDRIAIPAALVPALARGKPLEIAGVGAVDLALDADAATRLLRDGFLSAETLVGGKTQNLLIDLVPEPQNLIIKTIGDTTSPTGTGTTIVPNPHPGMTDDQMNWQMPTVTLYVPIVQNWTSNGYLRGNLINTFSLAPQEQITVEVFSWDRRKSESETTLSRESQQSVEQSFSTKATQEIIDKTSQENGWKLGAQVGFQIPQIGLNAGVDGSIQNSNEASLTNTLTNVSESVAKVAASVKSSQQTKVTEAQEYGTEERITRKFQNPNFGRVLHFDCFEVLQDWTVTTSYDFAKARPCVLLPAIDLMNGIDSANTGALAAALLGLEGQLFDHVPARLQGGFEAARLILAWERICQFSCDTACSCESPTDSASANTGAAAAGNPYEADLAAAMIRLREAIKKVRGATGQQLASVVGWPATPPGYLDRSADDQLSRRQDWHAYLYRRVVLEQGLATFWSACTAFDSGFASTGSAEAFAANITRLRDVVDGLIPSVASMLNTGFAYGSVGTQIITQLLQGIHDFGANLPFMLAYLGFHDYGLQTAATRAVALFVEWNKVEEDKKKPVETAPASTETTADSVPARRTTDAAFSAEALAAASVSIDALVAYLRHHRFAYQALLWSMLSPEDRQRYVDLAQSSGTFGPLIGTSVLGYFGGTFAIALSLDSPLVSALQERVRAQLKKLGVPEILAKDVRLPVPGMTMQTRLEPCDALEPYLAESRSIELARLRAQATLAEIEAKRRSLRLDDKDYSDPSPALPPLRVETTTPD